jgi:hypothetical protein
MYAGTYGYGLFESADDGQEWVLDGLTDYAIRINAMAPDWPGSVIIGTERGLYRDSVVEIDTVARNPVRLDSVHAWEPVNSSLFYDFVTSVVTGAPGNIYMGTAGDGFLKSTDNGQSWVQNSSGLVNAMTSRISMAMSPTGYLFCGTSYGTVFKSVQPEPLRPPAQVLPKTPMVIRLEQNYPNPFNPTTQLPFSLERSEFVSLIVYNALGQKVTTLINGNLPAGEHTAIWDASPQPSGVYFYRLQTSGGFVQTGKMILSK